MKHTVTTVLRTADLASTDIDFISRENRLAVDSETSGLDWIHDSLDLVQIYAPTSSRVFLIRQPSERSRHLHSVFANDTMKVFHHARFDLRFFLAKLSMEVQHVACTKVLGRLLMPEATSEEVSLSVLAMRYLGVTLDKAERRSNWENPVLSESQLTYATNDVIYLPALYDVMTSEVSTKDLGSLAQSAFDFLPTRARLDLLGIEDPFRY